MSERSSRGPWMWPLALAAVGVVLLLDNFLLLGDFNLAALWPLILVAAGAQILLRGDLLASDDVRTFGITRGSVESATLEIQAADIDVQVRGLQREGRLIAGQFAAASRPQMRVSDLHAHLRLDRAATPWFSFADWEMALARDLPWQILVSTHLGQVRLDLSGLIVGEAIVGTGLGDIRVVAPREAFAPLRLRSALGNIHLITPVGHHARVIVAASRLFRVHTDPNRYEQVEPGVYLARDADNEAPLVTVTISGTFGDAFLS